MSTTTTLIARAAIALRIAAHPTTDRTDERGASLVEYALLMAFIAAVCVGAVTLLGPTTAEPFSELRNSGLTP